MERSAISRNNSGNDINAKATPGSSPGRRCRIRLDEMCYGSVELENDASWLYTQ